MVDFIIVAILVLIIGAAVVYLIKAKKKGIKCIGCPDGESCAHAQNPSSACSSGCSGCGGSCGCHTDTE